jgi:hypothetical protein
LVRADALTEAQAIAAGKAPEGKYDTEALDWLNARIATRYGDATSPQPASAVQ